MTIFYLILSFEFGIWFQFKENNKHRAILVKTFQSRQSGNVSQIYTVVCSFVHDTAADTLGIRHLYTKIHIIVIG